MVYVLHKSILKFDFAFIIIILGQDLRKSTERFENPLMSTLSV